MPLPKLHFRNNTVFSTFYFFVKFGYPVSDEEIKEMLAISDFVNIDQESLLNEEPWLYYCFTEVEGWIHVMSSSTIFARGNGIDLPLIEEVIKKSNEAFYCDSSEFDDFYLYLYGKKGKTLRKYIVSYPDLTYPVIQADFGKKLENEAYALTFKSHWRKIVYLAKSIGINLNHDPKDIRYYAYIPETKKIG